MKSKQNMEKCNLSRSDSWNKAHCIPLRFVDHHRRRNSWTVTRKASQDSNMSSSRNGKIIIRPKKLCFLSQERQPGEQLDAVNEHLEDVAVHRLGRLQQLDRPHWLRIQ